MTIEGWNLNNPDENLFTLEYTGEDAGHCTSDTCMHYSHAERGPVNRLVAMERELVFLGMDRNFGARDPEYHSYYKIGEKFLRVEDQYHYGLHAEMIEEVAIPPSFNNGEEPERSDPRPHQPSDRLLAESAARSPRGPRPPRHS